MMCCKYNVGEGEAELKRVKRLTATLVVPDKEQHSTYLPYYI